MPPRRKYDIGYRITVYVDLKLARIIQQKAWEQHKSVSEYIAEILQEHIEKEKQDEKKPMAQVA